MEMRERFENKLRERAPARYYNFTRDENEYEDGEIQEAWEIWQAGAASQGALPAAPPKEAK